jgi:hypothetical protein
VSSSSVPEEPPGIPLEGARVLKPEHEAEHARHRQVTERLDRVVALLEELVQLLRPGKDRGRSVPLEDVFRQAEAEPAAPPPAAPAAWAAARRRPGAR